MQMPLLPSKGDKRRGDKHAPSPRLTLPQPLRERAGWIGLSFSESNNHLSLNKQVIRKQRNNKAWEGQYLLSRTSQPPNEMSQRRAPWSSRCSAPGKHNTQLSSLFPPLLLSSPQLSSPLFSSALNVLLVRRVRLGWQEVGLIMSTFARSLYFFTTV